MSGSRPKLPSLNSLRAFEAVARHESFLKAAEELNVTSGAVTHQIRQLEDWVGKPLFERFVHGLTLTSEGRAVLPMLVEAFDLLGATVHQLRTTHQSNDIQIAALPCIAQLWLAPRMLKLRKKFPDLQFSVAAREEPPNFAREIFDFAIFYGDRPLKSAELVGSRQDVLFPVCSPTLLEKSGALESPDDLAQHTLLHDAVWHQDWADWLKFAKITKVSPREGPTFSLYALALQSAADGAGFLMARRSLVKDSLESHLLVAPFSIEMPAHTNLAVYARDVGSPNAIRQELMAWFANEIDAT